MEPAYTGGLFQYCPSRQRFLIDEDPDMPLANKRGRGRARRRIGKEYLHVALANFATVNAVNRARVPFDSSRDFDGIKFSVGRRRGTVGIFYDERDFCVVPHRTRAGAGENNILHAGAAHRSRAVFAHDPAHRFEQIGFSAAVRADNAGETRFDM